MKLLAGILIVCALQDPPGGKQTPVKPPPQDPPKPAASGAVLESLKWLSRHQNADGSWSMADYTKRCGSVKGLEGKCEPTGLHKSTNLRKRNFETGLTALTLLAFVGGGYAPGSKEAHDGIVFGDTVKRGLDVLIARQDKDGAIGRDGCEQYMYNHSIATMALAAAYGATRDDALKAPATKAVEFLLEAQNPGKGWRYVRLAGENDTSVTGWAATALHVAKSAKIKFDEKPAFDGARAWFDQVTYKTKSGVRAGYQIPADIDVYVPGVNNEFDQHPTTTAIMIAGRRFIDGASDTGAENALTADLPEWNGNAVDFYYWYWGTLALYQAEGPEGAAWRQWGAPLSGALLKNQVTAKGDDRAGSWEPVDRWSCVGGRVYATALNAITLEIYYRYETCFGVPR